MLKQLISLFVVIFVAVVAFAWVESYSPSFQQCVANGPTQTASNNGTQKEETSVAIFRSYVRCTERLASRYNSLITALATVFLGAITFGLVLSGVDQQRTTRAQLRAYLMLENAAFARPDLPNGDIMHWHIHVVFKNFGETPAYDVVFQAERKLDRDTAPADTILDLTSAATISPPMVIAPNHIHTLRLGGFDNGRATWAQAHNERMICFLWGRVDYTDTFGRHHFTRFQMVCNFGQVHQFGYCQRGNGTDDKFRRLRNWWGPRQIPRATLGTEGETPVTEASNNDHRSHLRPLA